MELKGTIIQVLPEVSGVSKAGKDWKKREYVLEYNDGNFARKAHFTCFGNYADSVQLQLGQTVTISFEVESREYNGRWYTDLRCWRAVVDSEAPVAAQVATPVATAPVNNPQPIGVVPPPPVPAADDEQLPF